MSESHRPTGEHPETANVHQLDLNSEADRLAGELPGRGRVSRTLAREGGVSVVLMAMEAGDTVREHGAPGTTTVQVTRGHVALSADGASYDLRPGQAVMFRPGIRHDVRAEEQSIVLLTIAERAG